MGKLRYGLFKKPVIGLQAARLGRVVPNDKPSPIEGKLIDARFALTKASWEGSLPPMLFSHAVLCQVSLPYRNPGEVRRFQRISGKTSLQLEAGWAPVRDGGFKPVGLPYGPRARLVLLHLCSEAVKNNSSIVEVDQSFTGFARRLGLSINGRNLHTLRDQVLRISLVSMRLSRSFGDCVDLYSGTVFDRLRATFPDDERQQPLWSNVVEFSPRFYESLRESAVPLRVEAIQALSNSSRGLDVYSWLAHRLYRVKRPTKLSWWVLRSQFGTQEQRMATFKRAFKAALTKALYVYPDAKVEVVSGGILIKSSRPPVPFKKPSVLEG